MVFVARCILILVFSLVSLTLAQLPAHAQFIDFSESGWIETCLQNSSDPICDPQLLSIGGAANDNPLIIVEPESVDRNLFVKGLKGASTDPRDIKQLVEDAVAVWKAAYKDESFPELNLHVGWANFGIVERNAEIERIARVLDKFSKQDEQLSLNRELSRESYFRGSYLENKNSRDLSGLTDATKNRRLSNNLDNGKPSLSDKQSPDCNEKQPIDTLNLIYRDIVNERGSSGDAIALHICGAPSEPSISPSEDCTNTDRKEATILFNSEILKVKDSEGNELGSVKYFLDSNPFDSSTFGPLTEIKKPNFIQRSDFKIPFTIDLFSVALHEVGHALGYSQINNKITPPGHIDNSYLPHVLNQYLPFSTRKCPSKTDVKSVASVGSYIPGAPAYVLANPDNPEPCSNNPTRPSFPTTVTSY